MARLALSSRLSPRRLVALLMGLLAQTVVGNALLGLSSAGLALLAGVVALVFASVAWYLMPFLFLGVALVALPAAAILLRKVLPNSWLLPPGAAESSAFARLESESSESWYPFASDPIDPAASLYENKKILLSDLLRDRAPVLEERTFKDCAIIGPAIVAFAWPYFFQDCKWYTGAADEMFMQAPENKLVAGIAVFHSCTFIRCDWYYIGIIAPDEQLKEFKEKTLRTSLVQTPATEPPPPGAVHPGETV
jgi:hypothetical protein